MRASDAEREAVVERLRQASVEGRLTFQELTERTEAAYTASTRAELALLTADLPDAAAGPVPAGRPPSVPSGRKRRWYAAVLGDTRRRGKWRVDSEIGVVAVMGDVTLDLREAEVRSNVVDILVTVVLGDVKIIVPDGVDVDLEGFAVMGDKKINVLGGPAARNMPKVRVRAWAVMGDVKVVGDSHADPIRRAWFDWSDWWLERRARLTGHGPHHHLKHSLGIDRHQLRELGRYAKEQLRDIHRDLHDIKHDLKRGRIPQPPPPPRPPDAPPPLEPPRRW